MNKSTRFDLKSYAKSFHAPLPKARVVVVDKLRLVVDKSSSPLVKDHLVPAQTTRHGKHKDLEKRRARQREYVRRKRSK